VALNRFLKSSLKKVVEDTKNWSSQLNVIQYVINNTYHSSINGCVQQKKQLSKQLCADWIILLDLN